MAEVSLLGSDQPQVSSLQTILSLALHSSLHLQYLQQALPSPLSEEPLQLSSPPLYEQAAMTPLAEKATLEKEKPVFLIFVVMVAISFDGLRGQSNLSLSMATSSPSWAFLCFW